MIAFRISLALSVAFPILTTAQTTPAAPPPSPPPSKAFVNPRAPADDPRVGLKGGLYDPAEAASGMVRVATLPKPPGFPAKNNATATPHPPPPPEEPSREPVLPPALQIGSTNSD